MKETNISPLQLARSNTLISPRNKTLTDQPDSADSNSFEYPNLRPLNSTNYYFTDNALIIESAGEPKKQEILLLNTNTALIPDTFTFEISPTGIVSQVYLFASVLDLLSYLNLYTINDTILLMAIGKYPSEATLNLIRTKYSYAKITLCFPRDFFFVIQEIRAVNILKNKSVTFYKNNNEIICKTPDKTTYLDIRDMSLSQYKKYNGGFSKFKTKKPKGYSSFLEQFYSTINK